MLASEFLRRRLSQLLFSHKLVIHSPSEILSEKLQVDWLLVIDEFSNLLILFILIIFRFGLLIVLTVFLTVKTDLRMTIILTQWLGVESAVIVDEVTFAILVVSSDVFLGVGACSSLRLGNLDNI